MRAWRVHEFGEPVAVLRLEEIDSPEPGPGQVQIRVACAALNFGDGLMCRGLYPLRPEFPFSPGLEVCGEIERVGDGVSLAIGQRVIAVPDLPHGGLAEACIANAVNVYAIPDTLGDVEAAGFLIPYQTGHVALHRRAQIRSGETLLVHAGAGGVGSAAIQLGVAAGAEVIATAGGAEKCEVCLKLGARLAIDYRTEDFSAAVREATDGRGADVIYDPVGGDVFDRSTKCVAWEGRILVVGFAGGQIPTLSTLDLLLESFSVVGVYMGEYSRRERPTLDAVHAELLALHGKGAIRPLVGREISMEEVPVAIRDLGNRQSIGKIIIRIGDGLQI